MEFLIFDLRFGLTVRHQLPVARVAWPDAFDERGEQRGECN